MAKNRIILHLECGECGHRNYYNRISKKRVTGKLSLKKFCSTCRVHKDHKETK